MAFAILVLQPYRYTIHGFASLDDIYDTDVLMHFRHYRAAFLFTFPLRYHAAPLSPDAVLLMRASRFDARCYTISLIAAASE